MKTTYKIMTIEPMRDCWKYSIIEAGCSVTGTVPDLQWLELFQRGVSPDEVFIDEGFRTMEVRQAAEKYGWTLTRGF